MIKLLFITVSRPVSIRTFALIFNSLYGLVNYYRPWYERRQSSHTLLQSWQHTADAIMTIAAALAGRQKELSSLHKRSDNIRKQ